MRIFGPEEEKSGRTMPMMLTFLAILLWRIPIKCQEISLVLRRIKILLQKIAVCLRGMQLICR